MPGDDGCGLGGRLTNDRGQVDVLPQPLASGVGARQQEEVRNEPPHPPRRAERRVRHLALLARKLGLEQLQVGQDAGERRAQLV